MLNFTKQRLGHEISRKVLGFLLPVNGTLLSVGQTQASPICSHSDSTTFRILYQISQAVRTTTT